MNISDLLKDKQGLVQTMASQFGIDQTQVTSAMSWLAPALSRGLQRQVEEPSALESFWGALTGGNHERYVDEPNYLGQPDTISDGKSILGHIFGTKDVSRNVAGYAAKETGISSSVLKKMLPVAATVVMGMLKKKMVASPSLSPSTPPQEARSGIMSWLDNDKDGSVLDDMLGMAFKSVVG